MGLQTRTPSEPPLSAMACLDVETPAICRVLQLRLQQRRTREQLVEQGIMPPLKTPAAFHEQIRSLERARTGNFLKHKICSRPERSELVRMHILQETQAEPSLQATQMKLKRARLADDLNEKIAQRPGPMELVVKNILPVDTGVKQAIVDGTVNYPKTLDVYNFDEDSSDAMSPEQPASQESHSSSSASPRECGSSEAMSTSPQISSNTQSSPPNSQCTSDLVNLVSAHEQQSDRLAAASQPVTAVAPTTPAPILVKHSQLRTPSDKSRSKKSKEAKPRVKKLKYHQYIPPDQKQEPNEVPMDSAYAHLLQQQQQFLQLQILSQQQQHYNYQAILPAPLKPGTEGKTSCSSVSLGANSVSLTSAAPVWPSQTLTSCKPGHLPANLDEMKVAELKTELKLRGLPVSGTKTDLIERLRCYQESSNSQPATTKETTNTVVPQSENTKISPPVSPIASKVSSLGIEDSSPKLSGAPSPAHSAPCGSSPRGDSPMESRSSEKDKRLHEKERQIEELMRKLEQEQRLVEELKMQLEVEKRSQQGDSPPRLSPPTPIQVKEEIRSPSNCLASCSPPGLAAVVKQEEAADQSRSAPSHQFIISQQQLPQTLKQSVQPGAQIILPVSLPASAVTIHLPNNGIKLHTTVSSAAPGLIQTAGLVPQKIEASAVLQQQCTSQTQPMTQTGQLSTSPRSGFQYRADQSQVMEDTPQHLLNTLTGGGCPVTASSSQAAPKGPTNKSCPNQPALILQQPKFTNHISKCKDPPRYEDAVKQTRSMQTAVQVPTATSQHMDDLFDVLIESGEISPFVKQDPPNLDRLLPVTANITTLPISTVLSRPPPQIQVAQLPAPPLNPPSSLVTLGTDNQLETLLVGTLVADTEPRTLRLMEELHSQLNPHSPMDTMELDFNDNTPTSAFHLQNTNLDNMDWLDLTMSVPAEGVNSLGSSSPVGVFPSEFLDSHELQLNWD
ncbi:myocardin-related transcription factor B isoform X2 [Myripristis murdjan]|uniref:myocardin-related transcription factor B isoform X2 n=1 Tax=Myripristis murdjan TaxID=586833 RepID=UPI00117635BF|nr:myocardin-related transcription factor B-like isoform X2 [Myripristis murdjan]